MPRTCSVCSHPQKAEIDAALVVGDAFRNIVERFGTSIGALFRHKAHLPVGLAKAKEAGEVAQADSLLDQVRNLQASALRILSLAENAGDLRTALGAIREARGNLALLAELLGELQQGVTVNIVQAPEWIQLQAVIIQSLDAFPDAKTAVVHALTEVSSA